MRREKVEELLFGCNHTTQYNLLVRNDKEHREREKERERERERERESEREMDEDVCT